MPTIPGRIYGEVVLTRHTDPVTHDYGVTVDRADLRVLIDPTFLDALVREESSTFTLVDDLLTIRARNRVVAYRLTGWEGANRVGELMGSDVPEVDNDSRSVRT